MDYIIPIVFGYLMGSIPFGLVLCKIFGYGDIRKIGSGNIGATNVLRTGNKPLAIATLLLDIGKGAIAVIIVNSIYPDLLDCAHMTEVTGIDLSFDKNGYLCPIDSTLLINLVGLSAIIGHCYPVWLKFKGGKGVATTLGTLLAAMPFAGVIACVTWLIAAFAFKISSLSALIAMIIAPIATFFIYGASPSIICALISALVFWKHRENIGRLRKGEESKISFKKKKDTDAAV